MKGKKNLIAVAATGFLLSLFFLNSAFAFDKLFVVANQKSLDLAKDFITSLNNESIPLSIVLDQYEKVKKEKFIVILGGAKGPGSVDEFIKQILSPEEQKQGDRPGGRFYIKENLFAQEQSIIVFTGPDEAAAAEARKNSRKTWWTYFTKWFELETSQPMAY
jgi:hypothetical protein